MRCASLLRVSPVSRTTPRRAREREAPAAQARAERGGRTRPHSEVLRDIEVGFRPVDSRNPRGPFLASGLAHRRDPHPPAHVGDGLRCHPKPLGDERVRDVAQARTHVLGARQATSAPRAATRRLRKTRLLNPGLRAHDQVPRAGQEKVAPWHHDVQKCTRLAAEGDDADRQCRRRWKREEIAQRNAEPSPMAPRTRGAR